MGHFLVHLAKADLEFSLHWYLAIILFPGNLLNSARRPVPALRRSGRYDKSDAATISSRSPDFVPETPKIGSPATSNAMLPPESDLGSESAGEMGQPKNRHRWSMNTDDNFLEGQIQSVENEGSVEENGMPRVTLQRVNGYSTEPADIIMKDVEASLPLDATNQ